MACPTRTGHPLLHAPLSRVLFLIDCAIKQRPFLWAGDCPPALARYLFQPRGPRRRGQPKGWPSGTICTCTRWGLPCPDRHRSGGALLPHRFTLTAERSQSLVLRRFIFCGTFPDPAAGRWVLPTTLSYRARTFLPAPCGAERPFRCRGESNHERPSANKIYEGLEQSQRFGMLVHSPQTAVGPKKEPRHVRDH